MRRIINWLPLPALVCLLAPLRGADPRAPIIHFRMVVSEGVIGAEINEGDAKVAMQAWRDAVVKETGFLVDVHVCGLSKLVREVREHQVDGFTMTTLEFLDVERYASRSMMTDEANAKGGDEYVLLVHDDSGIRTPADLRHKSLNISDNRQMSLAALWLETLLASSNLGAPEEFLGRTVVLNKLSRVVLPVYFRQSDACLVTRRAFSTMCELNPQLGRKLRAIASSPKVVSTVMAFHKDCPPEQRETFQNALTKLHKTVAGQQALTLFESGQLVIADASILGSTLELVKAHERIRPKGVPAKK